MLTNTFVKGRLIVYNHPMTSLEVKGKRTISRREFLRLAGFSAVASVLAACAPDQRPYTPLPDLVHNAKDGDWIETDTNLALDTTNGSYDYMTTDSDGDPKTETVNGKIYTAYTEPNRQGDYIRVFLPNMIWGQIEGEDLLPQENESTPRLRLSGRFRTDDLRTTKGFLEWTTEEGVTFLILDRVYDPQVPTPTPSK